MTNGKPRLPLDFLPIIRPQADPPKPAPVLLCPTCGLPMTDKLPMHPGTVWSCATCGDWQGLMFTVRNKMSPSPKPLAEAGPYLVKLEEAKRAQP